MGKKRVATIAGETTNQPEGSSQQAEKKAKKKKKTRTLEWANFYIRASYNNTMITVTDENGGVVAWSTAGASGFKGPRKATPYAATRVVGLLLEKLEKLDMKKINLYVSGIGSGRDSAVRSLTGNKNLNIISIKDITPLPHNGCRPKRRRRK